MRSTLIKASSLLSLRLSLCQAIWGSQRNIIILVTANIYSVLAPSKNLLNPVTMYYLMGFLLPPSEDTYRCATGLGDVGDLPKVTQLDHLNSSAGVRALGGPGALPSPASHPPHPAHCIGLNDLSARLTPLSLSHFYTFAQAVPLEKEQKKLWENLLVRTKTTQAPGTAVRAPNSPPISPCVCKGMFFHGASLRFL